jgi:hypothetical protein
MMRGDSTWNAVIRGLFARMPRIGLLLVVALVVLAPGRAHAQRVPPDIEAAIHLKVLSFDSALKAKVATAGMVIGVVYNGDKESQAAATAMATALTQLADKKKMTVHGKAVKIVTIPLGADLDQRLATVGAAYVSINLAAEQLASIAKVAEARKVPTLSSARAYLSSGVAIAVVAKEGKPAIVVHAGNAKRSGMILDSKLLRLAEVIK